MSDLSIFRYFDLNRYSNLRTFHVAPGFELHVKISKPIGCNEEFILILSHFPSLTYLAFCNKDASELMMRLPGITDSEDQTNTGDIFLDSLTVKYDLNDKKCSITLSRNGFELKRFALTIEEYKAFKSHTYEVAMMFERFNDTEGCNW